MATAYSSYSEFNLPPKAVDGDVTSTQWFANFGDSGGVNYSPLPAWIEVDLQGSYTIDSFKIIETSKAVKDFSFQVWDTSLNSGAGDWSTTLTVTGNPATPLTTYKTFAPVTTTKIRLYITAHNSINYLRLNELEVYGKVAETLNTKQFVKQPFSIFPNPTTNGIINIVGDQEVSSAEIYDILGAKIKTPFENAKVSVQNLASGVYFLKINKLYTIKFIKK